MISHHRLCVAVVVVVVVITPPSHFLPCFVCGFSNWIFSPPLSFCGFPSSKVCESVLAPATWCTVLDFLKRGFKSLLLFILFSKHDISGKRLNMHPSFITFHP